MATETPTPTPAPAPAAVVAPPAPPPVQPAPHAAGTRLREYETIFLVRPDLAEDLVDKVVERMRGIVTRDGGKVLRVSNWGKKKTAFEVKKHLRAIYIHVHYLGDSKIVSEFERNLRMTDDVLKYQSVKIAADVDPNVRPVEADVKLPGDPEVPERSAREEGGFGDREGGFGGREGGFGRDREGGFGRDREGGFGGREGGFGRDREGGFGRDREGGYGGGREGGFGRDRAPVAVAEPDAIAEDPEAE